MNLIALVVFLSSNILTPLSYASAEFDEVVETQQEEQEQGEILDTQEPEEDDGVVEDSSVEASDSDEDIQEEDTQDSSEPHPTPLLIGEGSTDEIGTGEVDNETPMDSSATPQNDEGDDADNSSVTDMTAPQTPSKSSPNRDDLGDFQSLGSETLQDDLSLCEERGTACGGEVDSGTGEFSAIDMLKDAIEALSGEILTGNIELLTGENLTGEVLTGDMQELTGTDLELSIARETLNTTPITDSKKYDKVTVNVLALPGTFPEGTYLEITPVVDEKLEEITQKILDENEKVQDGVKVEEGAKMVAFDIKFLYKLSNGSGVELQPKDGESVKVTFDFTKDTELKGADKSDEQEIQIYHINDKDENGEKVAEGEEVVEKIDINVEESQKFGETVIDAESFSTYVVTYGNENPELSATLEGDDSARNSFSYKTIKISDGTKEYILMDRNLGARVAWNTGTYAFGTDHSSNYDTASDFYGYYYQWGNNYGFSAKTTARQAGPVTVDSSDMPSKYSSSTWINTNPWNSENNLWGNVTNTDEARQGPCPTGWHVPSSTEWSNIRSAWCTSKGYSSSCTYGQEFAEALQMPTAGYRYYSSLGFYGRGSNGNYWSSTPYGSKYAYNLFLYSSDINPQSSNDRSIGFSVRCLKNSPSAFTLTFNVSENGGTQGAATVMADAGTVINLSAYPAEKAGYTFLGWNTDKNATTALSTVTLNDDTTVYAIFKKTVTVIFSKGNGVYSVTPPASTSCTAWNTATTCSVSPATATCIAGYRSPTWSASTSNLSSSITTTSTCTACTAGTYTTAGNTATSCTDCEAGYYCPAGSAKVACTTLGTNYTHSATKSTSATACYMDVAAGSYKTSANGNATTGCGNGKYSTSHTSNYGSADNSCTNIEAGCYGSSASSSCPAQCQGRTKYSAAGASECSTVSVGYYTTGCTGNDKCTGQSQCTAGTSCSNGVQSSCVASTSTVAGTYSSNAGATSCTTASDGNYVATAGASGQTQCTVGNYCKDGKIIACPSGYTSDKGAKAQTECYITVEGGKYLGTANGTTQTECAAGTYKGQHNVNYGSTSSCEDCTAGNYCPQGSSTQTACTTLGDKYTNSAAKSTVETACYMDVAAGSYKTSANGNTTSGCGAGKYSAAHTSNYGSEDTSCSNIDAGCYGSSASNSCPAQCQGRTKYSGGGASACSDVSVGYYTTGCGSDGNKCTGQSQCTAGTACSDGVQSDCVASSSSTAGTYSSLAGATSCTTASDGYYVVLAKATGQTQCTEGNYCKDGKIIACPDEYTSNAGASAENQCYKTLTANFTTGNGVESLSPATTSDTCTMYSNSENCTVSAPTINCKSGYSNGSWSSSLAISSDIDLIATCEANSNTPYQIIHYQEQLDGSYVPVFTGNETGETDTTAIAGTSTGYVGFTFSGNYADNVLTGNIAGNGSLVLKLYYTRNSYDVSYVFANEPAGHTDLPTTASHKFGESVEVAADASAPGYTFSWNTGDFTMPARDVIITGTFVAETTTPYKVVHYQEQLDGSYVPVFTGDETGETDTTAIAGTSTGYVGFTFSGNHTDNVLTGNIAGNGSLVLKLYYTRNGYDVSYVFDGKIPSGQTAPSGDTYRYQATVPAAPARSADGYDFVWSEADSFTMPANDVVITGTWTAHLDTKYHVQYMLQDVDGDSYSQTGTDVEKTGETDTEGAADIVTFEGFTFSGDHTDNVLTGNIAGDESLVLKLYYDRNQYAVSVDTNDSNKGTVSGSGTYRYGKNITLIANHLQGYRFDRWMKGEQQLGTGESLNITVNEAMNITGHFVASGNTYKVEHWQQNILDDNYTEVVADRQTVDGMTDADTAAVQKPYEGFTLSGDIADYQTRILPDGSTVVRLYYTRNSYDVSYVFANEPAGHTDLPATASHRYGESVNVAANASAPGYTFSWNTGDFTMPARDIIITGTFVAETTTPYQVVHYQEQLNGSYLPVFTGDETGETDTTAIADTTTGYEGFTFSGNHADNVLTGNIAGNGSLVLKLYYDRNKFKVVWKNADGTVLETDENVKYGSDASYDGSIPTKAADTLYTYTFKGWTPDIVQKVVGDAEYTATFEATRKGSSGGGGGGSSKSSDDKTHGSAEDTAKTPEIVKDSESTLPTDTKDSQTDSKENQNLTVEESDKQPVSEEMVDAYTWAKGKGITTMPTIEAARVDEGITREELAKMMVVYMSKILGKKPVKKNVPKYWDVSVKARGQELYDYTILAYQYQIMGINANGTPIRYFNPSGKVTRAEFATVLSRVLYGNKYNQKGKYYYRKHIKALENAGILTNTDANIQELRGWIMLMLQRSAM